jgi:AcrR family transcriptional regulator
MTDTATRRAADGAPEPYAVAARALLRDSLLDAAGVLLRDRSWGDVTMAEVARTAGVSRQTLYNEFGSRPEFAQAYVLREADRFMAAVELAISANAPDAEAALGAAFDVFLSAAAENPLVRAVLTPGGESELLPLVTTRGESLVERATTRLTELIVVTWRGVGRRDAVLIAELLVRLAISHVAMPAGPAAIDGAAVRRALGPFVSELTERR